MRINRAVIGDKHIASEVVHFSATISWAFFTDCDRNLLAGKPNNGRIVFETPGFENYCISVDYSLKNHGRNEKTHDFGTGQFMDSIELRKFFCIFAALNRL
jgi:hypothetical protein